MFNSLLGSVLKAQRRVLRHGVGTGTGVRAGGAVGGADVAMRSARGSSGAGGATQHCWEGTVRSIWLSPKQLLAWEGCVDSQRVQIPAQCSQSVCPLSALLPIKREKFLDVCQWHDVSGVVILKDS